MSLCLAEQKLGSHSQQGSSSDKFSLKGKQTGGFHKGHSWVFRAESHDMMMAWYDDIKTLTEKTGAEKAAFLRKHARSVSGNTNLTAPSVSSDGLEEDEADATPYAADQSMAAQKETTLAERPARPEAGGRFPSDIDVSRHMNLQAPLSPSSPSGSSDVRDEAVTAVPAAAAAPAVVATFSAPNRSTAQSVEKTAPSESDVHPAHRSEAAFMSTVPAHSAQPIQEHQQVSPISPQGSHELSAVPRTPTGLAQSSTKTHDFALPVAAGAVVGGIAAPAITPADEKKELVAEPFPDFGSAPVSDDPRIVPVGQVLADASDEAVPVSGQTPVTTSATGEKEHFHQTGHIFPSVLRHDTDMSVSQLHVPGEFTPRGTSGI